MCARARSVTKNWRVFAVLLVLVGVATNSQSQPSESRVVHAERTDFGAIFVVDEGPLRVLRFGRVDGDDQSVLGLDDPTRI